MRHKSLQFLANLWTISLKFFLQFTSSLWEIWSHWSPSYITLPLVVFDRLPSVSNGNSYFFIYINHKFKSNSTVFLMALYKPKVLKGCWWLLLCRRSRTKDNILTNFTSDWRSQFGQETKQFNKKFSWREKTSGQKKILHHYKQLCFFK